MPKSPRHTGTIFKPVCMERIPKQYRELMVRLSIPPVDNLNPEQRSKTPLTRCLRLDMTTRTTPANPTAKYSGEPNFVAARARSLARKKSITILITPPPKEPTRAAERAV